jgi:O-antigen/teichoic acid export membrane protein
VPTCFLAVAQGALQGEQRFGALAVVLAAAGAGRLVGGLAVLAAGGSAWQVVTGVGAGTAAAAAVGWSLAGLPVPRHGGMRKLLPVLSIAAGTGGVWALANLDIVLARAVLSSHDAGLYAVGALATRAVLWAPQFLTVSSFAQFTDSEKSWTILVRSAEKVVLLGAVAVLTCWAAGPWLVRTVFGAEYDGVGPRLWGFAALGLVLALVQLLVSQRIARHDETATYAAWGAAAAAVVIVASGWPGTIGQVLASLLVVAAVLAALLVVRARLRP